MRIFMGNGLMVQRKYVESRGLPSVTMAFTPEHYERVKKSYYHIMNGLGMANAMNALLKSKCSP